MLDPEDELFDRKLAIHLVSLYYKSSEQEEQEMLVSCSSSSSSRSCCCSIINSSAQWNSRQASISLFLSFPESSTASWISWSVSYVWSWVSLANEV